MIDEKRKIITPAHIGIITDGCRRWAKERNLPLVEGHRSGLKKIRSSADYFFHRQVKAVSYLCFSSKDWNRQRDEINNLMKLIKNDLEESLEIFLKKSYQVLISGRVEELPGDLPTFCADIVGQTKKGEKGIINICLNYSGRQDIIESIKKMMKNNIELEQVHEGMVKKYLYNGELPEVDIVLRTGGEENYSDFLLWQAANAELFFMKKYWPDFEEQDAERIINEYNLRILKIL